MKPGILVACAIATTSTLASVSGASDARISPDLLNELNGWLDTEAEYSARDVQPRIVVIDTKRAKALEGVADLSGGRTRGLYDVKSATIYLVEPWSPDTPRDLSVLLHEMVHHRQAGQHWYCDQAQEWRAYQIQAQWLAERQIEDGFYWPEILLRSSCARCDFHPG